jgi:hypothetical protein
MDDVADASHEIVDFIFRVDMCNISKLLCIQVHVSNKDKKKKATRKYMELVPRLVQWGPAAVQTQSVTEMSTRNLLD